MSTTLSAPARARHSWTADDGVVHCGEVLETVNDFHVVTCERCGFAHVLPLPSAEDLHEIYAHDYYSIEKPLYLSRMLEDKAWWEEVYADRFERLEAALAPNSARRLLDVGSGPGRFLALGRERGWQVMGIEPSSQAAAYSRDTLGLEIRECFLTPDTAPTLGRFDALNMGEVLEHLPDPAGMLDLAHGLLDEGGLLCVVVPNDFNPFQRVMRQQGVAPWWVAPPHHLNYFNVESLTGLTERCGFEVLHTECTFPIDMFLLMGQHYIGNDTLGREVHGLRKHFERTLHAAGAGALRSRLYRAFAQLGIGREVVMFARKRAS